MAVPKYDELFNPLLEALRQLGGSGTNDELDNIVAENLKLSDKDINEVHRGNRTKLSYRLAWSRNYLKRYGLVENSARGVWSLTVAGRSTNKVDKDEVKKFVKQLKKEDTAIPDIEDEEIAEGDSLRSWEEQMLETIKAMDPAAFERLCQRILRESGFSEVKVTGKSGDGGIDGTGIYKINGLISMRVIFQAKRYKDSVSSAIIREFKGTMSGRAEKGILITTATFTRDAKQEAVRDGSVPIDLVDGEHLVQLLKDLRLGCSVKSVEEVEVDVAWFSGI